MPSGTAKRNNIEIAYETLGDPQDETIIFISGLGSQLVYWTDELCQTFLARNFHLVRFDNRDTGLSSKTPGDPSIDLPDAVRRMDGAGPIALYTLSDMAADTISVLDALGIESAHVVGVSLGGMIAQTVAIEFPQRTRSLTSIMSAVKPSSALPEGKDEEEMVHSADLDARQDAVAKSVTVDLSDPDTFVDLHVEAYRVTTGPHFDEAYQRAISQRTLERCHHPKGWAFQMMAVRASGDRTEGLGQLTMPTLVIHGTLDPLIPLRAGKETAAAIPHAKLLIFDDMGHNLPRPRWAEIADAIAELRSESAN